jgi:hypothetical protein
MNNLSRPEITLILFVLLASLANLAIEFGPRYLAWHRGRRARRLQSASTRRLMELLAMNREIPQPQKVICCHCQGHIRGEPTAELISHGICADCAEIHWKPIKFEVTTNNEPQITNKR